MSRQSHLRSLFLLLMSSAFWAAHIYAQTDFLPGDVFEPWEGGPAFYAQWPNGPSAQTDFFPIAVWLQSPEAATARTYKSIGINTFVGLYKGPTEAQLQAVASLGIAAICDQNSVGLNSKNSAVIKSWMHDDEPDNAQGGTQDPTPPSVIIARYKAIKAQDASRPVYLNLGQGVACDAWYGRGNRTNHPEDYAEYALGADILSFDVYPMNVFPLPNSAAPWFRAFNNVVAQNIWFVAEGVQRLRRWSNFAKPVWVWIESTNINGDSRYALTPALVKSEVWMAIIHGARGIGYFCHQFSPTFIEAGLLADPQMRAGVAAVNAQITELAPVLNTQSVANGVTAVWSNTATSVAVMLKRFDGHTFLFAVAIRPGKTTATFSLRDFGDAEVEVIGEERTLTATAGVFQDDFTDHAVHIYKIPNAAATQVKHRNDSSGGIQIENFSNPFNQSTRISYSLPNDGWVTLKIYDALGRKAATLIDRRQEAGSYWLPFVPANDLMSGVLFCVLTTESGTVARKMIYVK